MKNPFLIYSFFFFFSSFSFSQETSESNVEIKSIASDAQGNVFSTGIFRGNVKFGEINLTSAGGNDIFVAKYNSSGKCIWVSRAGGAGDDAATSISADKNGNVCISGNYNGKVAFGKLLFNSGDKTAFFVARYNQSGDPVWVQSGKSKSNNCSALSFDNEGNIYATGYFEDQLIIDGVDLKSSGNLDVYFLKLTPSGKVAWAKKSGGANEDRGIAVSVSGTSVYFAGHEESSNLNFFLKKFSSSGDLIWTVKPETQANNSPQAIYSDANHIYLTGVYYGEFKLGDFKLDHSEGSDVFITKLNSSGKPVWMSSVSGRGFDNVTSICADKKGNTYVAGTFTQGLESEGISYVGYGGEDGYALKLNTSGKITWWHAFGNKFNDAATGIICDNNDNFFFAGNYASTAKFEKTTLTSKSGKSAFLTKINQQDKMEWAMNAAEPDPDFDPVAAQYYVNLYAKLVYGNLNKESLVNQTVKLENENGDVIQVTQTDLYGDFSFKNVDSREKVNLVIPPNGDIPSNASVFIASQNGVVLRELMKDKNNSFSYKLLPADVKTLAYMEEEDTQLKVKGFKKSSDKELLITENILYESGKAELDNDSKQILNKIAMVLKQNSAYILEIYAHTDAIGEESANLTLSENRASVVKAYIVSRGVPQERISAKGLGETKILNRCIEGVTCSQIEHQYNRRTEFKLLKK